MPDAGGDGRNGPGRHDRQPGEYGHGERGRNEYAHGEHGRRRRAHPARSFPGSLALTVLGAVLPGTGMLAAGRRRLGAVILAIAVVLAGVLLWFGLTQPRAFLHVAVQPQKLIWVSVVFAVVAIAWVAVIVLSHRMLRAKDATIAQRAIGSGLVCVLALAVLLPLMVGSRYAMVQRDLVQSVFASKTDRSATRPEHSTPDDPWGGRDRVNVLLLGGDGGTDRIGIRPDTILLASIDTDTGNTVLFSLPRNLRNVPFPPGSALAKAYPHGHFDGPGDPLEWMLNAMYRNVPRQHPGILKTDHPGADVMKLAVGATLGLRVDYFALVNLQGFQELINALGGVTVNVSERVPIGGSTDSGTPPEGWIEPGPHQHLDGFHALWFARGRWGSDDYHRMRRQRCMMKAIIDQANPGQMVRRYEAIAESSKNILQTDIPGPLLPAFVDLSMKVKGASLTSMVFDNTVIEPWDPDFDLIRSKVQQSLKASEHDGTGHKGGKGKVAGADKDHRASNSPSPSDSPSPGKKKQKDPADKLASHCAYHPDGAAG